MKTLILKTLLVAGLATTFIACEKDENGTGGSGSSASIVGTWEQTSERYVTRINGTLYSDTTIAVAPGTNVFNVTAGGKVIDGSDTSDYTFSNGILTVIGESSTGGRDTSVFNATVSSTELNLSTSGADTFGTDIMTYDYTLKFRRK